MGSWRRTRGFYERLDGRKQDVRWGRPLSWGSFTADSRHCKAIYRRRVSRPPEKNGALGYSIVRQHTEISSSYTSPFSSLASRHRSHGGVLLLGIGGMDEACFWAVVVSPVGGRFIAVKRWGGIRRGRGSCCWPGRGGSSRLRRMDRKRR